MPLNSLGENIEYTSDQDIKYMLEEEEDDFSLEFIGYLCEIPGYKTVTDENNEEKELFRAVISNGNKRFMLIIWDQKKIEELAPKFISGAILHLDGCQGHHIKLHKTHKDLKLLPYEILIHPTSVVQTKGFRVKASSSKKAELPTIEFKDIETATGIIKVKTYIKTVITPAFTRSGHMNFGSGSLTDGSRKIPIHVSNFKAGDSLKMVKGSCVLVTAAVSRTGKFRLICKNIGDIEVLEKEEKLPEDKVTKANQSLKRKNPSEDVNENTHGNKKSKTVLKESNNINNGESMNLEENFMETHL